MKFRTLLYVLALTMIPLLHGCSSPRITMEVASQPNVNPDSSGRPFRQGDFQVLFMEPMEVLGANLVAMDELLFVPGEARTVEYAPMPETRYVGILAGFRQMERAKLRAVLPVDPEKKNLIRLELNDTSMIVIDPNTEWSSEECVRSYQERIGQTAGEEKNDISPSSAPVGEELGTPADRPEAAAPGYVLPRSKQLN